MLPSSDPPGCSGGAPGCTGYAADPPPVFDLPPPPRPPWLEDLEGCEEESETPLRQLETCENTVPLAMGEGGDFESAFHSVAVVVVCALLVVMFALTLGVVVFR